MHDDPRATVARTALRGGRIVTLAGCEGPRYGGALRELGVIENAAMVCEGAKVVKVGPWRELAADAADADVEIDLEGRLVTPGFVDAHTHAVFAGDRAEEWEALCGGATYEAIASAGGGIRSTVRAVRAASSEELVAQARLHARWMLRGGTTTFEVKSGYGLDSENERKMLHVARRLGAEGPQRVVTTFLGAHAVPPEFEGRREEYLGAVLAMLPEFVAEGLVDAVDMFVEQRYFQAEDAERLAGAAREAGVPLRLHVDQLGPHQGAQLAARLGARTADHLEWTDAEGIAALAASGTYPVLLPGSVFGLRQERYPDARAMIEAGLPVVLATDFNPGSSQSPSMAFQMALACRHMGMTAAETLSSTTWNAACALGISAEVGSLELGKRADAVVWDIEDVRQIPYFTAAPCIAGVLCAGVYHPA